MLQALSKMFAFLVVLAEDAREQTLRVIDDHVVSGDRDYRELFTTGRSFLNRRLGMVYELPVQPADDWEMFEFVAGDRRRGLLAHASLNMLNSHEDRSSPTLRGLFVRETFLCQHVPPAPADVDFTLFTDDEDAADSETPAAEGESTEG